MPYPNPTLTVSEIVDAALEDVEAKSINFPASAEQVDHAAKVLQRMLKSWQNEECVPDFLIASQTVTATTSASYTLDPDRPQEILTATVKQNGIEIPMIPLSRQDYDRLPDKDATGLPTQFHYDRQREDGTFYVWPVFASVSGETFEITYERDFENITSTTTNVDVPGEWWDAVVLGLASRLSHTYGSEAAKQRLPFEAERAFRVALGNVTAGEVVRFC